MSKLQEYIQKYEDIFTGKQKVIMRGVPHDGKTQFPGEQGSILLPRHIRRVMSLKNRAVSILDYGCGQAKHLYEKSPHLDNKTTFEFYGDKLQCYYAYDPCFPLYNQKPTVGSQFDITICTDVLEHVPEEHIDEVTTEISSYTKPDGVVMITVSGGRALKHFEDGTNVHVTVKEMDWWQKKLRTTIKQTLILGYWGKEGHVFTAVSSEKFKLL